MAYTQLAISATPGKRYSFSAKTPAAGVKGEGPFTQLSVVALPGQRHSFTGKTPAIGVKGEGPFIQLSVTATPGKRYSFEAKAEYVAPSEPFVATLPTQPTGSPSDGLVFRYDRKEKKIKFDRLAQAKREDEEILSIIKAFLEIV